MARQNSRILSTQFSIIAHTGGTVKHIFPKYKPRRRNNGEYTVTPEVVSVAGGSLKGVSVSDKLANGFKVEFYGSATSVTLKLHVKGGFYSG